MLLESKNRRRRSFSFPRFAAPKREDGKTYYHISLRRTSHNHLQKAVTSRSCYCFDDQFVICEWRTFQIWIKTSTAEFHWASVESEIRKSAELMAGPGSSSMAAALRISKIDPMRTTNKPLCHEKWCREPRVEPEIRWLALWQIQETPVFDAKPDYLKALKAPSFIDLCIGIRNLTFK